MEIDPLQVAAGDFLCHYLSLGMRTAAVVCTPRIPLFTRSDEDCIKIALRTCNFIDRLNPRIVHIQDTMRLEEIFISEAMLEEARNNPHVEILSEPEDWPFDEQGNLW